MTNEQLIETIQSANDSLAYSSSVVDTQQDTKTRFKPSRNGNLRILKTINAYQDTLLESNIDKIYKNHYRAAYNPYLKQIISQSE